MRVPPRGVCTYGAQGKESMTRGSAPPRASVVRSPRMVMGESTHEMHAEL